MENPFKKEERFWNQIKAVHYSDNFVVIFKTGEFEGGAPSHDHEGFLSRKLAFDYAKKCSDEGLVSYVIDIRYDEVIAYLTEFCERR